MTTAGDFIRRRYHIPLTRKWVWFCTIMAILATIGLTFSDHGHVSLRGFAGALPVIVICAGMWWVYLHPKSS